MRLDLINEDKDVLLVEGALQSGILNEGALDLIDTATEALFGAIGFIPGAGEVLGDAPMLVKNIMQGDYLGAALYLVSMEPTPISDAIAKTLRAIQKLAKHTGQEDRLNRLIGWLVKKTGGNQTAQVLGLFEKAGATLRGVEDKINNVQTDDPKVKKSAGIFDKVTKYVSENFDKMREALEQFLGLIDERAAKLDPVGGVDEDIPDEYVADLTKEIEETYHKLRNDDLQSGTNKALMYKKQLRAKADKKIEVKKAYEEIFGLIPEIE